MQPLQGEHTLPEHECLLARSPRVALSQFLTKDRFSRKVPIVTEFSLHQAAADPILRHYFRIADKPQVEGFGHTYSYPDRLDDRNISQ